MDGVDVNYRLVKQKMIFLSFLGIPQLGENEPFADGDD